MRADEWVNALCNTLVQSLLQGIFLAAAAGLIVICTRRVSAALRYNLLVSVLLCFAAVVMITFIVQLETAAHTSRLGVQVVPAVENHSVVSINNTMQGTTARSFTNTLTGYLNSHANIVVLIWFLIICAKSIQLAVGLHGTYTLKRVNVFTVTGHWQARIQQLAAALQIKKGIRLLESGMAKVPLVIGHLKPVILIPLGLLTTLTEGEVEAILVHELAHIRRRDYLVNMLQSLVEIIFFFNPAVLWVSQLIKTERENCCDDLALQHSNNKANYIRALVSCGEYQPFVPAHAMAFPGGKHSLLNRVKRMAANRNHSLNLFEKTALAICLVISGLCISAFAEKQDVKSTGHKPPGAATSATPQATLQSTKKQQTPAGRNTSYYPPAYQQGPPGSASQKAWLYEDSMANEHIIADMLKDNIITDGRHLSFKLSGKTFIVNGLKQGDDIFRRYGEKYVPAEDLGTDWTWSHSVNKEENALPVLQAAGQGFTDSLPHSFAHRGKQSVAMPKFYAPPPKAYAYNYPAIYPRVTPLSSTDRQKKNEMLLAEILTDMMHDGIILQKDNFDFKMNATEFIVNGQKQDDAIFRRYSQKYIPADHGDGWTWTQSRNWPAVYRHS